MIKQSRYSWFHLQRKKNRFWWFDRPQNTYLPQIYADLTENQFYVMQNWFQETETNGMVGECNIPAMSTMLGIINGSAIDRIVEIGRLGGWSTLMFAFALERMGKRNAIFSIDINPKSTEFVDDWLKVAGVSHMVQLKTASGDDPRNIEDVNIVFDNKRPQLVFIDSSHSYLPTYKEMRMWYEHLEPGGLMILHDAGEFAVQYDKTGGQGVLQAVVVAQETFADDGIILNRIFSEIPVVQDMCGLAILQKHNQ